MDVLMTISQIIYNIILSLGIIVTGSWAIYTFWFQRLYETTLTIEISTTCTFCGKNKFIVFIDTILTNKSKRILSARPKRYSGNELLPIYSDEQEVIYNSVCLQIKCIKVNSANTTALDWFNSKDLVALENVPTEINLLSDYEVSKTGHIDFSLEPDEELHLSVALILPEGHYLARTTFIGSRSQEEYWSRFHYFNVQSARS